MACAPVLTVDAAELKRSGLLTAGGTVPPRLAPATMQLAARMMWIALLMIFSLLVELHFDVEVGDRRGTDRPLAVYRQRAGLQHQQMPGAGGLGRILVGVEEVRPRHDLDRMLRAIEDAGHHL